MIYNTLQDIKDAKEVISCPGDSLNDIIKNKDISQTELASRMGRPIKTINEIIMGKASITPETALQLERVLGLSANFWMERERLYRLDLAEILEAEKLLEEKDWIKNFPLSEMKKLNWITYENNPISKTKALFSFFSVASISSFQDYYKNNLYSAAFRVSTKSSKNPYAITAWLRRGDIQANEIEVAEYNEKKLKQSILKIKQIMQKHPSDFFAKLQKICEYCGVKLIYTPCLPKTPVSGATRWQKNNPLIQLTGRYKRNDIFWFTFFHEIGHILLHGKKDVFIEGITQSK